LHISTFKIPYFLEKLNNFKINFKKFRPNDERAKNGGVSGEEIFCPRADVFVRRRRRRFFQQAGQIPAC